MMNCRQTINDVYDDWKTGGGVFTNLQELNVPWAEEDIATALDIYYHGQRSGDKFIARIVDAVKDGEVLETSEKTLLSTVIMARYGVNWAKLWATREFEYNPIENYSMTENMTDDTTVDEFGHVLTRVNDTSHTKTGTETNTPDTTETSVPNMENSNMVYGFNSSSPVPTGESKQTGSNTLTRTGTETVEYDTTDADTGSITDTESGDNTHTRNYELTRKGNIGVTTSQQMIQSERDLWLWDFFEDVVFPDVDKILTLSIY